MIVASFFIFHFTRKGERHHHEGHLGSRREANAKKFFVYFVSFEVNDFALRFYKSVIGNGSRRRSALHPTTARIRKHCYGKRHEIFFTTIEGMGGNPDGFVYLLGFGGSAEDPAADAAFDSGVWFYRAVQPRL